MHSEHQIDADRVIAYLSNEVATLAREKAILLAEVELHKELLKKKGDKSNE